MNGERYWRNLRRRHEQSMSECARPGAIDQNLNLVLAALCALVGSILFIVGGYRIGFSAIHGVGHQVPAILIEILSKFGETFTAICLIALIAKQQPRTLWMGVLAGVYATLLTHALKGICDTARPAAALGEWVTVSGPVLKLHSFPSGHTTTAFLLAACFSIGASGSTKVFFYALAAAVGVSRVWVGAHWPIDGIVGAGVACLSVGLAIRTMKFANFGLRLTPHLLVVSLIAVCAVVELTMIPEYPLARLLGVAIALVSVFVLAKDYLFRPLMLLAAPDHIPPSADPQGADGNRGHPLTPS